MHACLLSTFSIITKHKNCRRGRRPRTATKIDVVGGDINSGGGMIGRFQAPPAFLIKTFNIVNDPTTNSIISWGEMGDSFIIKDHIQFTAQILPNYFRHNNLSSFVYQLNNYGFRKIGVAHQWEYSHPDFQAGKQHLLSNMRRRSYWQNPTQRRHRNSIWPHMLRNAIDESKHEINKLKMQHSDVESLIVELEREINDVEAISKKMMAQWAKACEIVAKRKRENDDDEGVSMREKKVAVHEPKSNDKNGDEGRSETMKENTIPSSVEGDDDDRSEKSKGEEFLGDFFNDWKRILLEGDEVRGGEDGGGSEIAKQHSQIAFQEFSTQASLGFEIN